MKKLNPLLVLPLLILLLLTTDNWCLAQNVGINSTGASANPSAGLDVDFSNKGTLITRMTTAQRDAIATSCSCTPATGLQVFNTTTNCLEMYIGTTWQTVACGCTGAPAAAGTISGTATVCSGQSTVYSVSAISGATSYTWSYSGTGATIVGSTNTAIIYFSSNATSGNLTVRGTNTCGNGTVSSNYAISISSTSPAITGQPSSPSAVCTGTGTPSFTVTATGGTAYQWQEFITGWADITNAGVYSGATSATLTITNPTTGMNGYKYRCVVSGACGNTTSDGLATLTVNANVAASVSIASTASNICAGTNVTFTATPANGGTPSYQWKVNGGNVGTNSNTYASTTLADNDAVICIMTSNAACVTGSPATSNTITMNVSPLICNLVSYWKFDEVSGNAADSKGNNTLTNNNGTSFFTGIIGNGADLELSSSQSFSITNAAQTGLGFTGSFSLSFWAKFEQLPSSAGSTFSVFFKSDGDVTRSYAIRFNNNVTNGFECEAYGDGTTGTVRAGFSSGAAVSVGDVGVWRHYAATFNASTVTWTLYKGGSAISSNTVNNGSFSTIYTSTNPVQIGGANYQGGGVSFFDGGMDEIGAWNRVLTGAEITSLYNSGAGFQYPF